MGVDYLQRKAAKKRAKSLHRQGATDFTAADEAGKRRDRKKRSVPKKRSGVCFGQPLVTEADKRWTDDEDSDADASEFDVLAGASLEDGDSRRGVESKRAERLKRVVPFDKKGVFAAPEAVAEPEQKRRRQEAKKLAAAEAAAGRVRLSTAVNIQNTADQSGAQRGPAGGGSDGRGAKAPAMRAEEGEIDGSNGAQGTVGGVTVHAAALEAYHPVIRTYMALQKFVEPTEVQKSVWPHACKGRDVQARAQPGAGKTLAFVLPMAARLVDLSHGRHSHPAAPLALTLSPTRELAMQTFAACKPLQQLYGLRSVCVYGGVEKEVQVAALARKPHVVVATPGRLLDLVNDGKLSLASVLSVALDECDKMLGLGFAAQLELLSQLLLEPPNAAAAKVSPAAPAVGSEGKNAARKRKRKLDDVQLVPAAAEAPQWRRPQVLLLTATMPDSVLTQASRWLSADAVRVAIDASPLSISSTIHQVVQVCAEHKKPAKLLKHLHAIKESSKNARSAPRVLVFANRVKTVRFLHKEVTKEGFKAAMLHGQRSQTERDSAVRDFKAGKVQLLIATDIAARGLHVRHLPYIVNYDFPGNMETYIHRVGRTGRLQAYGHAFTFFTRNLVRIAPDVVACLRQHKQPVDPNLLQLAEAFEVVRQKLGADGLEKMLRRERKLSEAEAAAAAEEEGLEGDGGSGPDALLADDVSEGLAVLRGALKGKAARGGEHRHGDKPVTTKGLLPAANAAARPEFVPGKRFSGRRPGYVFKLGSSGLGYYLDKPPAVARAASKPVSHKGGIFGAAYAPDGSDDDLETAKKFMAKRSVLSAGGSAADAGGADTSAAKKRKALPGRLRKKLAKMRKGE